MIARLRKFFCLLIATAFIALPAPSVFAQHGQHSTAQANNTAPGATRGILLMAHGGSVNKWNDEVLKIAQRVNETMPTEVAFGMASKRTIQDAVDKLVARGVREIVAVPLFISSHSSVITSTQYLLGLRPDAPPDLAIFARMNHSHGAQSSQQSSHDAHGSGAHNSPASHAAANTPGIAFDPTTPVKSPVPIRMTAALDRHPMVADILLERAREISREPAGETLVVVAHGPVPEDDNARWLADMKSLVELMRPRSSYKRIEYLTVRDDAPDPVRAQATAELRRIVERATKEGNRVLIVPLLLSYGGIEEGVRKRLEGLNYEMSKQGLLPDERLARWVLSSAQNAGGAARTANR